MLRSSMSTFTTCKFRSRNGPSDATLTSDSFEPTDDDLEPFPTGLKILGGDPYTRTAPEGGAKTNLDPSKGPIQNVKFTCPRLDNNYTPASWPEDSDGSTAGMQDPINQGEGAGFPDVTCDGYASPLRADIHMPSCYNPEKGLDNHKENMAWPSDNGNGKLNCPKGHVHVPHLFFEIYWDTPKFQGRWEEGQGKQPFVFSNGDATGFSSHADFMAAWDEKTLRHIIETCDATDQGNGMDQCPGLQINTEDCTIEPGVDEKTTGHMSLLPGDNPLLGWSFGLDGVKDIIPDVSDVLPGSSSDSTPEPTSSPADNGDGLPVLEDPATNVVENPAKPEATSVQAESPDKVEPTPEPPAPEPVAEKPVEEPKPETTSCSKKIHTVWETVTMTENVYAEPTAGVQSSTNNTEGGVSGFQYAGCFKDADERVLSGAVRPDIGKVSNEKCVAHCKEAGFLLAGTEYGGECYCGNELVGSKQLDDTDCSSPCADNTEDVCGGDWALSVYSESGEASIASGKARRHLHAHHLHGHRRSHH